MFKESVGLFLLLIVAGSDSRLVCPQLNRSKCDNIVIEPFVNCLKDSLEYVECEPPKVCILLKFLGNFHEFSWRYVYLYQCGEKSKNCSDIIETLLGKNGWRYMYKNMDHVVQTGCKTCETGYCRAINTYPDLDLWNKVNPKGANVKNSTAVPSTATAPKSKGGSGRSHTRITMQQMWIFVLIILLSPYF